MTVKCPLQKEKYKWKCASRVDLKCTKKNIMPASVLTSLFVLYRMDDILIGAPLFMEREFESSPKEVGQVYLYMQARALVFRDPQVIAGTEIFGRFGSAVAHLGDLNQDGYNGNLYQYVEIVYLSEFNVIVS